MSVSSAPTSISRAVPAALAVVIALVSSVVAFRQDSRPDPFRPATWGETFSYPMQTNAFAARTQVIRSDLEAVFALPDGKHVWAAGSGGLLLRSTDGGRTWSKGTVVTVDSATRERVIRGDVPPPLPISAEGKDDAQTSFTERAATLAGWMGPAALAAQDSTQRKGGPVPQQQQQQRPPVEQSNRPTAGPPAAAEDTTDMDPAAVQVSQDTTTTVTPPVAPSISDTVAYTRFVTTLHFADERHGWAEDDVGGLLVTWDGGSVWHRVPRVFGKMGRGPGDAVLGAGFPFGGAAPPDPGAVADDSTVERMASRVLLAPIPPGSLNLTAINWTSPTSGYAVSDFKTFRYTTDGGARWRPVWGVEAAVNTSMIWALTSTPAPGGSVAWAAYQSGDPAQWAVRRTRVATGGVRVESTAQGLPPIVQLAARDSLRVLAFTLYGPVLRSVDGGATWPDTVPISGANAAFFAGPQTGFFGPRGTGWIVGDDGTVYATEDGGESWTLLAGGRQRLAAADFATPRIGWAVGADGAILHTRSGGRWWTPQQSGTREALTDVHALSTTEAVVVGEGGAVLRTTDGGERWVPVAIDTSAALNSTYFLRSLHFTDGSHGWAVGARTALETTDGGQSWRETLSRSNPSTPNGFHNAVHFTDRQHGAVAGLGGSVLSTTDGGQRWVQDSVQTRATLNALFLLGRRGWAVGDGGTILRLETDSGRVWRRVPSPTTKPLRAVHFIHPDTGWAAGEDGTLLATTDGGRNWRTEESGIPTDLTGLASSGARVWAVGEGATVLERAPGGGAWTRTGEAGTWWPAPWYFATWAVVLGLVAVAARPAPPPQAAPGVAGMAVNDRPLGPEDRDAFELGALAAVISRFLRNDRTDPPLTLAVTGPWGSGKSSLMNLVSADLRENGWRPVLFNAWHHQTEEHLLAALLENVRAQAIPGWFERGGLRFRLRLFSIRFRALRPAAVAGLLLAALYAGYFLADPGRVLDVVPSLLTSLGTPQAKASCKDLLSLACAGYALPVLAPEVARTLLALLSPLLALAALGRSVRAFATRPATLLQRASEGARLRDLEKQTSFRHRFAKEFDEVTEAMKPNDLVIFVDDLDRCRPRHVLDVLEGINFLVSSGRCVVILGMDPERVVRCVGLGFRDEAEEVVDDAPAPRPAALPGAPAETDADADRRKRSEFARQYLEKLVNIEVPIPPPGAHQFAGLADWEDHAPAGTAATRAWRWSRRHAPQAFWLAAACLMLVIGRVAFAPRPIPRPALEGPAADAAPAASLTPSAIAATAPDSVPAASALSEFQIRPGDLLTHEPGGRSWLVAWLGLAAAVAVAALRLANRAEPTVSDSPRFQVALRAWAPYVARRRATPRAFKKFLNRVRYYAMRQRAPAPPAPRWTRLLDRAFGRTPEPALAEGSIPEEVLVGLAALHECEPTRINDDATYLRFRAEAEKRMDRARLTPEEQAALVYDDAIPVEFRDRFKALVAGVRVG